jgi:hypothetical protein
LKKIILIILFCHVFQGCDKDPISGLERGWIWDAVLSEKDNESTVGELRFDVSGYDGNFKIFEGITTAGVPVLDRDVSDGDIFTETLPKGDYTIKWVRGGSIDSDSFTHGKCTTISLWYSLIIYENYCD